MCTVIIQKMTQFALENVIRKLEKQSPVQIFILCLYRKDDDDDDQGGGLMSPVYNYLPQGT